MDSNVHSENFSLPESTPNLSRRNTSSNWSKASRESSIREVDVGDLGSIRVRHGSRGADSEGFSRSLKEISDEDARLIYINDPAKTNEEFEFSGNSIRTGKYSVLTFLPRNLYEQFHRVAYIYFLVIAILNQLPQLAVFGRGASILPLAFVLLVTAVKDAYEDYRRHRSDKIENKRLALVFANGEFQPKKWKDIRVGEIIKVFSGETIPCDMALLSTSDTTGVAYVQTINLDGESNLKTRYAKQETQLKIPEKDTIEGLITCEKPNRNIYGFQANMEIDGKRVSLGPSNIILRGCELKNTAWAIGVVVYAGRETKVMLNGSGAPSKRSRLETRMNREIIFLSFFLVALCTIVSVLAGFWLRHHKDELDIIPFFRRKDYSEPKVENYNYYGWGLEILFTFLSSVIVYQIMIPISLYISMELVRVGQAYFMVQDSQLFDEGSNSKFQCRALNINEDLGQIKFIFSDKTGTLTENKMEFQCASISGVDYGSRKSSLEEDQVVYEVQVNGQVLRPKIKIKVDPELLKISKGRPCTVEGKHVHDFFLALAACNTIVPLAVDTSDPALKLVDYTGESPDEQALVYAAAAYGFMLVERTSGHIVISVQGEMQRFNVLGLHEFDSDRKRMSVILGCPDNTVKVFVKGADTSMFSVIDKSLNSEVVRETEMHLNSYSSIGLRTLVVGMRELSASDFGLWQSSYEAASTAVIGRAALLRKVANNIENNVNILGASGIEDKLQQGVPEAIESLRIAGIKVWVLTGDKQETAISIGYSSKLLTSTMTHIVINSKSANSCRRSLEDGLNLCNKKKLTTYNSEADFIADASSVALIIDGTSLVYILDDRELEEKLFQLASNCNVVLCCRVAPLQKAGIVALVKNRTDDMTLAIGDGANDVSMIQMADVGVGISGQEGRQAVMASDFAMGQFRFLVPLLLVHGHWNYQRMGYMILYNFYRNAVFVLVLFWYALFTAFTLTTAVTDWSSMLYSIIYTALPTIVVGVLDKDLSRRTLLKFPQLYGAGQRQEGYNGKLFWATIVDTVWQSAVAFFVPLLAYWKSDIDVSSIGDLWTLAVVILVNIHLAMDVIRWSWITHAVIWGSIIATVICVVIIDALPFLPGYWAIFYIARDGAFWFCLLGIIVAALVPRFVVKVCVQHFTPRDIQIAREGEKFGNIIRRSEYAAVEMNQIVHPPR
ncbi:PREDICTED: phospholipid-transporting ATPase 1-like [Ipomoea nil]|uniref:phospholipid-transporting ATPase 1-like n=1 Tax=Ipomoea nil TaxID=35883 RepID=UPI0009016DAB|nr:PREDICTED: phospholipid-transporting ATPase 1-like [Ipomoea nil]